jgi:VanZ family protein
VNRRKKEIWKAWLAAILWLILIAIESTDWFSSSNTSRILYPVLHFLFNVDPVRFEVWNFYIRKTGHVCGYFGLSLLLYRSWRATIPLAERRRWSVKWSRVALFMTVLVACLDEWHQTYIPSRTGTVKDILLDSSAAVLAQLIILAVLRGRGPGGRKLLNPK